MPEHRGISIALSPELVNELKATRGIEHKEKEPKGLEVLSVLPVVSVEDDWRCVLPISRTERENEGRVVDDDLECIDDIDDDVVNEADEDDASVGSSHSGLSYTPPHCLPVVLVDVQRLAGYLPSSPDEVESLTQNIRTALWGEVELPPILPDVIDGSDEKKDTMAVQLASDETEEPMVVARDFDQRVTDLFATGMARHSDTSFVAALDDAASETATTYVAIDYPEYLCRMESDQSSDATAVQVLSTARVWKQLMQPHPIAVVDRLLQTWLRACSRSLIWKLDMRHEIVCLVEAEDKEMKKRQAEEALREWKSGRRKEQLDKLYAARETLAERYQQACDDQTTREQERDGMVQLELLKRREVGRNGGLATFDFESTVFAFPDNSTPDLLLGFDDEDEEYQCEYSVESNDCNSRNDSQSCCDSDDLLALQGATADLDDDVVDQSKQNTDLPDSHRCRKERRQRSARIRQQRLGESVKEAEHKEKLDTAKCEEERVREQLTTLPLRMAAALSLSLQAKLHEVDDLLETMQEEQWADEEDAEISNKECIPVDEPEQLITDHSQFSLLDQVLAMILGACPPSAGIQLASHVCELEKEHRAILVAWLDYFGRLPPAITSPNERGGEENVEEWGMKRETDIQLPKFQSIKEQSDTLKLLEAPQSLRAALGIVDNENDWDADELQSNNSTAQVQNKRPLVGFRPGGHNT